MKTAQEKVAFEETCRYIHNNFWLSAITNLAYKKCARLITTKEKLVEIGCGTGDFIPYCPCEQYIGLDISKDFISTAQQKFPQYKFVVGDAYDLPFENRSVKSIISFAMLEHLKELNAALEQVNRVLMDDGEFIFGIPTEGLLYRIGRNITTKRHVQKATGANYDELLKKEHVNKCEDVLSALKKHFIIDKLAGVPLRLPIINLNVIIVGRCIKRFGDR
jgi:ubiquinone/menaquinone biosynthesis C-methylase UbiE